MLVDPMLATGGSAAPRCARLRRRAPSDLRFVCLVAAPEGIDAVRADAPGRPDLRRRDRPRLDERGFIRPGLGDAGDRLFGTD